MRVEGASVVLMGAGSGIGRVFAEAVTGKGVRLTLVGRREAPLVEVARRVEHAGSQAQVVPVDLGESGSYERVVQAALDRFGSVDVLVNNAGNVRAGRLEQASTEEIRAQVDLNVLAPILLSRAALGPLRDSGGGLVVNVSSTIALVGLPFYATYAAAKAGVAHFGESRHRELHGEGVSVLTVYPGARSTPMMETSRAGPEHGFDYEPPEAVAAAIVHGIETDQRSVVRASSEFLDMNRSHPEQVDAQLAEGKNDLERAVAEHASF